MKRIKLFEEFSANKVECNNCGWSWKLEDGGDDLYICHECGYDNTPILGESMSINEKNLIKDFSANTKRFLTALKEEGKETYEAYMLVYNHVVKGKKMDSKQMEMVGNQFKDVLKTIGLTAIAVMPGGVIVAIILKVFNLQKHMLPSSFEYMNKK